MLTRGGGLLMDSAADDISSTAAPLDTHASAIPDHEAADLQQAAAGRSAGGSRLAGLAKKVALMAPKYLQAANPRLGSAAAADGPKHALKGSRRLDRTGSTETPAGTASEAGVAAAVPDRADSGLQSSLPAVLPAVPEEAPAQHEAAARLRQDSLPDTPMAACSRASSMPSPAADEGDAAAGSNLQQEEDCASDRLAAAEEAGPTTPVDTWKGLKGKQGAMRSGGADSAISLAGKACGRAAGAASTAHRKATVLQGEQQPMSPEDADVLAQSAGKVCGTLDLHP